MSSNDAQLIVAARAIWPFRRDPLAIGVEEGIVWATQPGFVGVCGYALIPAEGHPWSRQLPDRDYIDDYLYAHGGITYYTHPWVGFDTGHAGDIWPPEWDEHGLCDHYRKWARADHFAWHGEWTPDMVAEEAKGLARQISEVGQLEKRLSFEVEQEGAIEDP